MMNVTTKPASMRRRLSRTLVAWSLLWSVGVSAAVWLAAQHELKELLDQTLADTASLMAPAFAGDLAAIPWQAPPEGAATTPDEGHNFAWQVVSADGKVLRRSLLAPAEAFLPSAVTGFSDSVAWRIYGLALGREGRVLYVAQTSAERFEAMAEVALSAVLAAWSIGLLGYWWVSRRLTQELAPIERLSQRLGQLDPSQSGQDLPAAERIELQPMHDALNEMSARLARRVQQEQSLAAHAAHALRTPLAGMDAQLAVALAECDPASRKRLQKVRAAGGRLQRVVAALITLFRTGNEAHSVDVDVAALAAQVPVEGVSVRVEGASKLRADPDLLAAALANLLDNAQHHGAQHVVLRCLDTHTLEITDDGPGVQASALEHLQQALAEQAYERLSGMGLMLADRVARAHGGALSLASSDRGLVVTLRLGPA
jgi:signal transduction histidine kinase